MGLDFDERLALETSGFARRRCMERSNKGKGKRLYGEACLRVHSARWFSEIMRQVGDGGLEDKKDES